MGKKRGAGAGNEEKEVRSAACSHDAASTAEKDGDVSSCCLVLFGARSALCAPLYERICTQRARKLLDSFALLIIINRTMQGFRSILWSEMIYYRRKYLPLM